MALGLGLVTEEQGPTVGAADQTVKARGQGEIAVLGAGDFEVAGEFVAHGGDGVAAAVEGFVERGGEEAGFEAGGAEDGLLGEGDALDGEEFLGVDGAVDGDEVVCESLDLVEFFESDDGKSGGGEAVLSGVLRGAGFALGGARSGGTPGVGAVGGE
jgi:hypothetical protein